MEGKIANVRRRSQGREQRAEGNPLRFAVLS